MQVSVNLIDRLSITGLEYGITFLATQIFADFEIKYLSLPESYDNNFAIPCLPTLWSIINVKNISGLCLFGRQLPLEYYGAFLGSKLSDTFYMTN